MNTRPAMLVVFKLVEARTGGRKQNHFTGRAADAAAFTALSRVPQEWIEITPRSCDSIFSAAEPMV